MRRCSHLERRSVRANDSLSPLDEALFVADNVADLDDIACLVVTKDLDGLRCGIRAASSSIGEAREVWSHELSATHLRQVDSTSHKLDHVPGVENRVGIECLPCRLDRHATLDQVECAGDALWCCGSAREPQPANVSSSPSSRKLA